MTGDWSSNEDGDRETIGDPDDEDDDGRTGCAEILSS